MAKATSRAAQRKLAYRSLLDDQSSVPSWIDGALRKAVHRNPHKRQAALSEFVQDLRHPNPDFATQARAPLLERNPLLCWKGLSLGLFILVLVLLASEPALPF